MLPCTQLGCTDADSTRPATAQSVGAYIPGNALNVVQPPNIPALLRGGITPTT